MARARYLVCDDCLGRFRTDCGETLCCAPCCRTWKLFQRFHADGSGLPERDNGAPAKCSVVSVRFRFPGRKEPFLSSAAGATFSSLDLFKKCPNLKRDEVGVVAASAWSREPHSGDLESSVPVVRTAGTAGELPGPTKLLALDAAPKISIKDCVSVDQKCECERESPELTPSSRREKECA